jgi:dipeptidyl aminopeptidase/acylaminoacyl peptidase
MSRSALSVYLLFCIVLSACTSARAENGARQVESVQASINAQTSPYGSAKSDHTPGQAIDLAKLGAYSSSVLVADGGGEIETILYPIDPSSGEAVPEYESIPLGLHYAHTFSPDGRTLALVTFLSSKYAHPHSLVLLDLATWNEQVYELKLDSYIRGLAFSPDGRKLAIFFGDVKSIVMVFDRDREAVTAEVTLDFLATCFKYTTDGSGLMLYGPAIENCFSAEERSAGPPIALLLDAGDLSQLWRVGGGVGLARLCPTPADKTAWSFAGVFDHRTGMGILAPVG